MKVAATVLVLGLTVPLGCAHATRNAAGDTDPELASIRVENQSSETLDVYLSNARSGTTRLGRVRGLSRLVFHASPSLLEEETFLYSVPSNGTLGPFDNYATRPFTLDAPRDVLWVIEEGRRLSVVNLL